MTCVQSAEKPNQPAKQHGQRLFVPTDERAEMNKPFAQLFLSGREFYVYGRSGPSVCAIRFQSIVFPRSFCVLIGAH